MQECWSETYLVNMQGRFHKWQRILICGEFAKTFFPKKFAKNNIVYAAPTGIRIDFTSMISHVKSYELKYMISGNFFSQANLQVKTRQRHFVNFNFRTSVTFFSGLGPVQVASRRLSPARPWLLEDHLEFHSRQARPWLRISK